jgi:hypothetical protein
MKRLALPLILATLVVYGVGWCVNEYKMGQPADTTSLRTIQLMVSLRPELKPVVLEMGEDGMISVREFIELGEMYSDLEREDLEASLINPC